MVLRNEVGLAAQPDTVAPSKFRGIRGSTRLGRLRGGARQGILREQELAGQSSKQASKQAAGERRVGLEGQFPSLGDAYYSRVTAIFAQRTAAWLAVHMAAGSCSFIYSR